MKRIGSEFGVTVSWAIRWFKRHRKKEKKSQSNKSKPPEVKREVKEEAKPSMPSRNSTRIVSTHRPLARSRRHRRKKVERQTSNVVSSLYKVEYQAAER